MIRSLLTVYNSLRIVIIRVHRISAGVQINPLNDSASLFGHW
jgi:hypothetical protein